MRILMPLFMLLLSGCEMIVDMDIPFERSSLAVNCVFDSTSPWMAMIGQNRHVLDSANNRIKNAHVVLYYGEIPVDTLTHDDYGVYRSESIPRAGVQYEIRVSAPDFEEVSAYAVAPRATPIIEASMDEPFYFDGRFTSSMQIRFKDDESTENFYELTVATITDYISPTGEIHQIPRPVKIETNDVVSEVTSNDESYALQFKDILFNGTEKVLSFKAIDPDTYQSKATVWRLVTISRDLYEYRTTMSAQKTAAGNPFAQPVSVYNNIQNGFGIFAGSTSSTFSIEKPKPVITSVSPTEVMPGDTVIIAGENLNDRQYGSPVFFRTNTGWYEHSRIVRKIDIGLEVVVPEGSITGRVYVSAPGGIVRSDEDIIIID